MKKTRQQRRAAARKVVNVANQLSDAQNKAVLAKQKLIQQKLIPDDRRDDLRSTEETNTP